MVSSGNSEQKNDETWGYPYDLGNLQKSPVSPVSQPFLRLLPELHHLHLLQGDHRRRRRRGFRLRLRPGVLQQHRHVARRNGDHHAAAAVQGRPCVEIAGL